MSLSRPLRELADAWGVVISYRSFDGTRRRVSPDALVGVLHALGAPVVRPEDAADALRARLATRQATVLEPVTVVWGEHSPVIDVRSDAGAAGSVSFELALDDGSTVAVRDTDCRVQIAATDDGDGRATVVRRFTLPHSVPYGLHRVSCDAGGRRAEAVLLAAPQHAYQFPSNRAWGVFAPVYALRTHREDPLPGDLADLAALADWAGTLGASLVGTLPLLASFLDDPYEPSPYAPVSRRFWNEVYAAPDPLPTAIDADGLVDLHAALARKRPLLEAAADRSDNDDVVRAFVARRPDVERYARFRAAIEQHGDWSRWPARWRHDGVPDGAVDPSRVRYHRYAQAVVDDQLGALAGRLRDRAQALYLDFPLGSHRSGYDVWAEHGVFVDDASVGAPPDAFFSGGQNWGFPPVHPDGSRADGHAYFAASIDHHLSHAGVLRIDHVMGLHRLWWIPPGHDAADGAYVRYPAHELYARLCLASVRHGAALIGENLGTVPPEVHRSLRRHRIGGMHIVQFELDPDAPAGVRGPAAGVLTSLDTHDTATFAGFWSDAALEVRLRLGLSSREEIEQERAERTKLRARVVGALRDATLLPDDDEEPDARTVMTALLELLGRSAAQIVLVSLEDLWLELRPQNVPGTVAPENWRRPAALALDELAGIPGLVEPLRRLAVARAEHRSEAELRPAKPTRAGARATQQNRRL